MTETRSDVSAMSIGWGRNGSGIIPTRLQELQITVFSDSECQERIKEIIPIQIFPQHICIINGDRFAGVCHVCLIYSNKNKLCNY